jgi:hypothetical protein
MSRVKDIVVRVIDSKNANAFVRRYHYSGKVVSNSKIHFGAFLNDRLHGVMQFGSPLDKRKVLGLVSGTRWNEMLELNRMAFDDALPKNSESRCIAIAMRLIRKNAPHIKWVLSFADGTQCGDGTIYRATGFVLTMIKENQNTVQLPDGSVIHKMTLESSPTQPRTELGGRTYYDITGGRYDFSKYARAIGGSILKGFQLRYIYFLHPIERRNLSVPILPFAEIDRRDAGMYKGRKRVTSIDSDAAINQIAEGGANPTVTLQSPNGKLNK